MPQARPSISCIVAAFAAVVLLTDPTSLNAQTSGTIIGRVVDSAGVALPNASVQVVGQSKRVITAADGRFIIAALPPGETSIRVEMIGFRAVVLDRIVVRASQAAEVRVVLASAPIELGGVTGEAQRVRMIEPDVSGSRQIVVGSELRELPIDKIEKAIELTPGVSNGHFRGGRAGQEVYVVDGLEVKNQLEASSQGLGLELSPTALEEVEVMTGGFGAQFGSALSGVVSFVTRRGSRERWQGRTSLMTDQWAPSSMFYGFTGLNASAGGPLRFLGNNATLYVDLLAQGMLDADPRARGLTCLTFDDASEDLAPSIENRHESLSCPYSSTILPHQRGDKVIGFARFDKELTPSLSFAATVLRNRFQRELYTPEFRYSQGSQLGQRVTGSLATLSLDWSKQQTRNAWHITARGGLMRIDRHLGAVDPATWDATRIAGFSPASFKFLGEEYTRSPIEDQLASASGVPGYVPPSGTDNTPYGIAADGIFFTSGTPHLANWARSEMASADIVAEMFANTGSSFRIGSMTKFYANESYERTLAGLTGSSPTYARFYPMTTSGFTEGHIAVSDEISFDVGMRVDAFKSGISFLRDRNDVLSPVIDATWNMSVNPRIGLSFPLASSDGTRAVRLNYGYVSQPPDFRYFLDTTIGDSLRSDIRRQGNPSLSFERGKSYEAGFSQLMFGGRAGAQLTVFRKELTNLVTSSLRLGETEAQQFSTEDEGTVKGAELTLRGRFGFWSVRGSYAWQKAQGVTTGVPSDTIVDRNGFAVTYPLAFDRRHSIDLVINAGRSAGIETSVWSGSLTTTAQSGYPINRVVAAGDSTEAELQYLPWTATTDLRITRELGQLPGCGSCKWRVAVDGRNLLGFDNVLSYRGDTGSLSPSLGSVQALANTVPLPLEAIPKESNRYHARIDTDNNGVITLQEFRAARIAAAIDRLDPSLYFGEPRQLRLGVEVSFR